MLGQIPETNRLTAVTKAKENHAKTHNNHHDNGGDLDHCKPELNFAVQTHGSEVS
ncbi:hypothetical protein D3C87_1859350 [compost metagenome]